MKTLGYSRYPDGAYQCILINRIVYISCAEDYKGTYIHLEGGKVLIACESVSILEKRIN